MGGPITGTGTETVGRVCRPSIRIRETQFNINILNYFGKLQRLRFGLLLN